MTRKVPPWIDYDGSYHRFRRWQLWDRRLTTARVIISGVTVLVVAIVILLSALRHSH
jgi:hypothetical protein